MTTVVSVAIVTDNPDVVVKSAEVLSRALAGLALEGIDGALSIGHPEDDQQEVPDARDG